MIEEPSDEATDESIESQLLRDNRRVLEQGVAVLKQLSGESYRAAGPAARRLGAAAGDLPAGAGVEGLSTSVGAHFRHVIEHYRCLLAGLPEGEVCYDRRARELRLEEDREASLRAVRELVTGLAAVGADGEGPPTGELQFLADGYDSGPAASVSSVARELQFVLNHTIHHYAFLRMELAGRGVNLDWPAGFGVAPATLRHRRRAPSQRTG